MKNFKYITLAFACCLMAGCMNDDWDAPTDPVTIGNNDITEENVVSIAQLKSANSSTIFNSTDSYTQFTEDVKIKGRVTGNDVGGNVYSEIAIDDGTGAILVCISEGGLFSYLPLGQEILIDLKDLYIGGYGQQPEIGTPYVNKNGRSYISRMNRMLWKQHFKLLGSPDPSQVVAEEFDKSKVKDADYLKTHAGKLMTIKNVTFKKGDGTTTFAPDEEKDAGNSVNRGLVGIDDASLVVRTSTYANFAGDALPTTPVNLTGIFTRYKNTWQILLRTADDIQPANLNQ